MGERSKEIPEGIAGKNGGGSFLECSQTQKQQGETHYELAYVLALLGGLREKDEGYEHQRDGNGSKAEAAFTEGESENPGSDRSAYIGSHYDSYGICQ